MKCTDNLPEASFKHYLDIYREFNPELPTRPQNNLKYNFLHNFVKNIEQNKIFSNDASKIAHL